MGPEQIQTELHAISSEQVESQDAHIARLNELADTHGADLDVLTDIYGRSLLDCRAQSARIVLGQLEDLHEAVSTDTRYFAVGSISKALIPGCYGFGQEPRYKEHATVCVIDRSDREANITYHKDDQPKILIEGDGYIVRPDDAQAGIMSVWFSVAHQDKDHKYPVSQMDFVITGNDRRKFGLDLNKSVPASSIAASWALEFCRERTW